jgi:hypothetical protein
VNINHELIFLRAAAIIEARGWNRGMMFNGAMGADRALAACCVLGAIWWALVEQLPDLPKPTDRNSTLPVDHLHFLKEARVTTRLEGLYISIWNDRVCKTQREMVAKLREIAAVFA